LGHDGIAKLRKVTCAIVAWNQDADERFGHGFMAAAESSPLPGMMGISGLLVKSCSRNRMG
jgi:hypothetical protein